MRNLKRVLSLALACVMVIGMMVMTTGAADIVDIDEVKNVEAVEVMAALGVLEGDENGVFNPTGILTREQAAKIICYMLMGPANAEMLTGTSAFTDVAADRWSAPFISYCASLDIISGYAGEFNPTGELTGVAFAKMLLVALGYDAAIEGYVNNTNWATNIGTDAIDAGIDIKGVAMDAALTRENAAQMAFNTLTATMVGYTGGTNVTTSDGTTIVVDAVRYNKDNTATYPDVYGDVATELQFSERYFEDLALNAVVSTDVFGRPSNVWTYGAEEIGAYPVAPAFTYTSKVPAAGPVANAMTKAFKGYTFPSDNGDTTLDTDELVACVDGNYVTVAAATDTIDRLSDLKALTNNGVLVEVYADRYNNITDVIVINTVVAQIDEIDAEKKTVDLSDVAGNWTIAQVDEDNACIDALLAMKEEDCVLITALTTDDTNYTVASVEVPEVVTGLVTKVDTDAGKEAVTIGGTSYKLAAGETGVSSLGVSATAKQNLFLDTYGYAIYTTSVGAATTPKVIYVVDTYEGVNADGKITNMIKGILTDGTVVTAEVDAIGDMKQSDKSTPATTVDNAGDFLAYTYTVTPAGKYDLTYAASDGTAIGAAINADVTAITKDTKKNSSNFYAENVNFIFVDGTTGRVSKVIEGLPVGTTLTTANDFVVYSKDALNNFVVTTVFVKGAYADVAADLIYVKTAITDVTTSNVGTKLSDDAKSTLYGIEVYVNGKEETIYVGSTTTASANSFYQYTIDSKSGAYVLGASAYTSNVDGDASVTKVDYVGGHYYIDSDYNAADLFTADNAVVVDATGTPGSNINTMAKLLKADTDGTVTVALVCNAQAKTIDMVYVLTNTPD